MALLPALVSREGVSIDVGANRGLYVEYLLPLSRTIIAFEPIPRLQARLRRVFGRKIEVMPYALSDRAGSLEIRYPKGSYSWATLSTSNLLEKADTKICSAAVQVRTLDSFDFQNVGFIKIDVEGHEEAVLAGAQMTIARCRPNFLIEVEERHNRGAVDRVCDQFKSLGYACLFVDGDTIKDISEFDAGRDQNPDHVKVGAIAGRYINNFLFVPSDNADHVLARMRVLVAPH